MNKIFLFFFIIVQFIFITSRSLASLKNENTILIKAHRELLSGLSGSSERAENLFIQAIRKNPYDFYAYIDYAQMIIDKYTKGQKNIYSFQQTLFPLLEQAEALRPNSPAVSYLMAEAIGALELTETSESLSQNLEQQHPISLETKVFQIKKYANQNPQETIAKALSILKQGFLFDRISVAFRNSIESMTINILERALLFEKYAKIIDDRWLWFAAGKNYLAVNDFHKAYSCFYHSLHAGEETLTKIHIAQLQYTKLSKIKNAIKILHTIKLEPQQKEEKCLVHSHLAKAELRNKNKAYAKEFAFLSAKSCIFHKSIFLDLVNDFSKYNQEDILIPALEYMAIENPNFIEIHTMLASINLKLNDKLAAISHLDNAIAISDHDPSLFSKRGLIYYEVGNFTMAFKDFEQTTLFYKQNATVSSKDLLTK
ncbi:MAG: hypothetical protein K2X39_02535 [Silvanigrellaceae bacterium]|nr:hypothetical protein [Silvanigrellaceae bacterium]